MRCPSSVRPSSLTFHIFDFFSETESNVTWQEARSQRPLQSLCFLGWSEKQDGRPALWLAETFLTSPLKPLNGIQRNLSGSKISTSSTKFVFFGRIRKTRWPQWTLIGWDIIYFSSETAEQPATKLDRKKDLNVLYQVCVFWADRKNKMAALANPSKRWHIVLRCTICGPLGLLFQVQVKVHSLNKAILLIFYRVTLWTSSLCKHGCYTLVIPSKHTKELYLTPLNLVHIHLYYSWKEDIFFMVRGQSSRSHIEQFLASRDLCPGS